MIASFGGCVASCGFKASADRGSWGYIGIHRFTTKDTLTAMGQAGKQKHDMSKCFTDRSLSSDQTFHAFLKM